MGRSLAALRRPTQAHPPAYKGGVGRWSNPATWVPGSTSDADLPITNQTVVIGAGQTFYLDGTTASIGDLIINGTLYADQRDFTLICARIRVGSTGHLCIGTPGTPYTKKGIIRLTGVENGRVPGYKAGAITRSTVGNGRLSQLFQSSNTTAGIMRVTWDTPTAFTVRDSALAVVGTGTNGVLFDNRIFFIAIAGSTAFQAGDFIEVPFFQMGFRNDGLGRSIQKDNGGQITMEGVTPAFVMTRVNGHVPVGTPLNTADNISDWNPGDRIIVGPTDFYGTPSGQTTELILNSRGGVALDTSKGVTASRWGLIQHVTDAGMALTAGTLTKPADYPQADWDATPKTIDQRADVANLTRNIVIEGIDDAAWQNNGFGAHLMFMGLNGMVRMRGVEIRRAGQAGAEGRYPLHWHMNSYNQPNGMSRPSDGTFLGAKVGDYIDKCVVWESSQRGAVIHGTDGTLIQNSIFYNIVGHCVFYEDGSERNNFLLNNLILKVRCPTLTNRLLVHDTTANGGATGTSGIWSAHPVNTLDGNRVGDVEVVGIWNSYANELFGLSSEVATVPNQARILLFTNNSVFCNGITGMATENIQVTAKGDISGGVYYGTGSFGTNGLQVNPDTITNNSVYKNAQGGYLNRVFVVLYKGWKSSDNGGLDFRGQVNGGGMGIGMQNLGVSDSLNSATQRATINRNWGASYHELLRFQSSIVVGYKANGGGDSGWLNLGDLYTRALFEFQFFTGLKQINQNAPIRPLPPHLDGQPLANRHWTYAGALLNSGNNMVGVGINRYWIFNVPFLTSGCTDLQPVLTETGVNNGMSTPDKFFGVQDFGLQFGMQNPFHCNAPITATRQTSTGVFIGEWKIGDGANSTQLSNMRHFCTSVGGRYLLSFPGNTTTTSFSANILNASASTDMFLLGVQFAGTATINNVSMLGFNSSGNYVRIPTAGDVTAGTGRILNSTGMTSIADIQADTTGLKYWHDKTTVVEGVSGVVWFKVKGGLTYSRNAASPWHEMNLSITGA